MLDELLYVVVEEAKPSCVWGHKGVRNLTDNWDSLLCRLAPLFQQVLNHVLKHSRRTIIIKWCEIWQQPPQAHRLTILLLRAYNHHHAHKSFTNYSDVRSRQHCILKLRIATPDPLQRHVKHWAEELVVLYVGRCYQSHARWQCNVTALFITLTQWWLGGTLCLRAWLILRHFVVGRFISTRVVITVGILHRGIILFIYQFAERLITEVA
jgi:hypothetical protein